MTQGTRSRRQRAALAALGVLLAVAVGALWMAWATLSAAPEGAGSPTARLGELYLELAGGEALAPTGAGTVTFTVAPGQPLTDVAESLVAVGVIRDAAAFRVLARVRGLDRGIQAGDYTLSGAMTAEDVLRALQRAAAPGVRIRLPEGRRAEEMAEVLEAAGIVPATDFMSIVNDPGAARTPELGAVATRPADAGLEGYLFPDTYEVAPDATAADVVALLTANFARRYAAAGGATPDGLVEHDVVTLASIVEREAQLAAERPQIARVFLNRLAEPPYLLGADPTVQFALGLQGEPRTWWKRPLTLDDLQVAAPYNTYVTPGLPPGPIANPGSASLAAVRSAAEGPWMYFVANEIACDGSHVFATTFAEHEANVAQYRTGTCLP